MKNARFCRLGQIRRIYPTNDYDENHFATTAGFIIATRKFEPVTCFLCAILATIAQTIFLHLAGLCVCKLVQFYGTHS